MCPVSMNGSVNGFTWFSHLKPLKIVQKNRLTASPVAQKQFALSTGQKCHSTVKLCISVVKENMGKRWKGGLRQHPG